MALKPYDRRFLTEAVDLARLSAEAGAAPVGVVLADRDGQFVSHHRSDVIPVGDKDKTHVSIEHAELKLLLSNQDRLGADRPLTLYVSLEPCHMCMGAAIVARIGRVVWALDDYWGGARAAYDSGRDYIKLRMPELVRTPYPDLQAGAAKLWVDHLNQYNLPDYIERMLRWQALLEE